MNDDLMIHNPMNPDTSRELQRRICHVLGISPEDLALLRALSDRMVRVENGCTTVTRRCDDLQNVLRQACCPANMLYSQITINENSHKDQVNIVTPVTGLGDPYVDDFPIPPQEEDPPRAGGAPRLQPRRHHRRAQPRQQRHQFPRHRRPLLRLDQAHGAPARRSAASIAAFSSSATTASSPRSSFPSIKTPPSRWARRSISSSRSSTSAPPTI
jgi:hypothetical protein